MSHMLQKNMQISDLYLKVICPASKERWTETCTVRARAVKMGRGGVFQHDNDPNTRPRQQRSVSRKSTLKSRSGRASLIENLWRELKV